MAKSRTAPRPKRPARKSSVKPRKASRSNAAPPRSVKIDYAKLSLKDALDLAILIEEEALERYQKLSEMVGGRYSGDARDVFRAMAKNEARHGLQLTERRERLFPGAERTVSRDALYDVEAPSWTSVHVFMSSRQAFEVALESERKAHEFFDQALPHLKDARVRGLFVELRGEEQQHAAMLIRKMKGLPSGPDVETEMADEPGSDAG